MLYSLKKWPEPPEVVSDAQRAGIEEVIKKFDEEAKHWEKSAHKTLLGIFVCFGLCLLVFVLSFWAGNLRSSRIADLNLAVLKNNFEKSVKSLDSVRQVKKYIDQAIEGSIGQNVYDDEYDRILPDSNTLKELLRDSARNHSVVDSLRVVLDTIARQANEEGRTNGASPRYRELDALRSTVSSHQAFKLIDSLFIVRYFLMNKQVSDSLSSLIKEKTNEQDKISQKVNQASSKTDLYDFINEGSIRIGAILILVFMVQYLSRIHRYNKKLADYYAARANALRLHLTGLKDMNYHKIVSTISPDAVDLRFVKAPTDKVFDVIKSALESGGKMMGK